MTLYKAVEFEQKAQFLHWIIIYRYFFAAFQTLLEQVAKHTYPHRSLANLELNT